MITKQDYQKALDVQDAVNLSGVVIAFANLLNKLNAEHLGTEWVKKHPISVMFSSKIASLTDSDQSEAVGAALSEIHKEINKMAIEEYRAKNHGFITEEDLPEIVKANRFEKLLVRCGCGRFTCSAQDVAHFMGIIRREKSDYIRDVSFPAKDEK